MTSLSDASVRYCLGCGYCLLRLDVHRCPECGRDFDPQDRASFALAPPKACKRWWRRFLTVTLVLLFLYMAALSLLYYNWRQEQRVVERVSGMDGVLYRPIGPTWVRRTVPPFAQRWLQRVDVIHVESENLSSESAAAVASLKRLRDVRLMNTAAAPRVMGSLRRSSNLKFLTLAGNAATGDVLRQAAGFRQLRQLILIAPNADPSSIEDFRKARPDVTLFVH